MAVHERGLAVIRHFEGLRLTAYRDPVGLLTIGYGHTGPAAAPGRRITRAEAERLLAADLADAEAAVDALVRAPVPAERRAALVSLAFNIGRENLARSTLLRKLNAGDVAGAAEEFGRWVHGTLRGRKVVLPGLVRRRAAERALFLGEPTGVPGDPGPSKSCAA